MKKYALLYFQIINDKFSKWMFPLHEGENIIGSDKDVDIFIYLNEKEDIIDEVHCKIIVNEAQNDVGIISLASKGFVKRDDGEQKITLSPGKEYELNHKSIFYLTDNVKFMLIKGTIEEIHDFFSEENLENEFQKWHQLITSHEIFIKFDLNLTRRESCNKSFVSNNNDINNNANLGTSINNNSIHKSSNKELNNSNINNSIDNSIFATSNKELNKLGFNNFDEVPDNLISNYRASQHNPLNSSYNKNILNNKNIIMPSPIKMTDNIENKNELDNNNEINSKSQIIPDLNKSQNNIINDKESNTNSVKSEAKEEINLNNKYNKEFNDDTVISKKKENYDNSLNLFKNASINSECKKNSNEKEINKDEKTLQTIRELLGDNNLEIIIKNTNNKNIKKFDIFFKKFKKGMTGTGNFDIKIKNNDFLKKTKKYEYKK
jgi:hypothetical protein